MKLPLLIVLALGASACAAVSQTNAPADRPDVPSSGTLLIDLPTALRLGQARNARIALAREQVNQAKAQLRRKQYLLIPTLSVGASWHHAEGRLQETSGRIREVSRSSAFFGGGAGAVGAGPIMQPGLSLSANLADVYFAPLAARQNHQAMEAASAAVDSQISLRVAEAYFELVRSRANIAVAEEAVRNAAELAKATGDFAASGEGLQSDAQRARVEELLHQRAREQAGESMAVAAAQLARLLHLEAGVQLEPGDANVAPVRLADAAQPIEQLVAAALANRPEIRQTASLIRRAEHDLKNARFGAALPHLAVGVSGGGMGGGFGGGIANTDARTDVNALIFWRFEGLGLGEKQRVNERKSLVAQARHTQTDVADAIVAEVRSARAQVGSRQRQIAIAEEAVRTARQSFELNRARIFQNQGLPIEALQAIQSLAAARRIYVDTVTEHNQAQYRLLTAVGSPTEDRTERQ